MKRHTIIYISLAAIIVVAIVGTYLSINPNDGAATGSAEVAAVDHSGHDHSGQDATPASTLDWCREHAVPESECTRCDPDLIGKFALEGDWCAPHDLPESHCRICNPGIEFPQEKLIQASAVTSEEELDWCQEHAVPESRCTTCDPTLIAEFKESGDWCGPHDLPESHCRLCNPGIEFPQEEILRTRAMESGENEIAVSLFFRPNSDVCATNGALIQFASATTAVRTGLSTERVRQAEEQTSIEAPADVVFDETKAVVVTSTVPALVSRWQVSPGDIVEKGDALALVQSPEIAKLQAELLSAHAAYLTQEKELARHKELRKQSLVSEADFDRQAAFTEEARSKLTSARGLLMSAGMAADDIDHLIQEGSVTNQFVLRSPGEGQVVERIAQLGDLMDAGEAFAMLADPSAMWIEARLTEEQIRDVEVGQDLVFASDGHGLDRVGGEIIWVSRFLDPHTRTATVRASVNDPNHRLQAGEFGRVTIVANEEAQVTLVPKDAVQWEGCCNVVFVKETDERYRPRKVELTRGSNGYYQVLKGLMAGEEIVVDGAFLLKTELKKSSIGAGCCGLEPTG